MKDLWLDDNCGFELFCTNEDKYDPDGCNSTCIAVKQLAGCMVELECSNCDYTDYAGHSGHLDDKSKFELQCAYCEQEKVKMEWSRKDVLRITCEVCGHAVEVAEGAWRNIGTKWPN